MTVFRLVSCVGLFVAGLFGSAAQGELVSNDVRLFLKSHCGDCHAGGVSEGLFDLGQLGSDMRDAASAAKWTQVFDRIAAGEMPPKDSSQPSEPERRQLLSLLGQSLHANHSATKGTVLRRLNRREYENTLNDLFGTNLRLAELLPEDGRSHEFDNVGETLDLSLVQIERYLASIDRVLDASIAKTTAPPESKTILATYGETQGADKFIGSQWHQLDDGAVVFFHAPGYPTGMLRETNTKVSGRYRIRVHGYAHQTDKPVTFELGAATFVRGIDEPTFGYFTMLPGKATTVETEAWIEERFMVKVTPQGLADPGYLIKKNGVAQYQGPGLAILWIELEGPLTDEFPSRGHRLVFDGLNRTEIEPRNPNDKTRSSYQPKFQVETSSPRRDATSVLLRVASKAFRRPVNPDDVVSFVELFDTELQSGSTFEESLRTSIAAVFCSPEFLFLKEPRGRLGDHALAARLSYFLTRTAPDELLRGLADAGQLKSAEVIAQQVDRLLDDPGSERLIADFVDAWLNLRDIDFTSPDRQLFPEFDPYLKWSMLAETRAYLRELIKENRPVTELVKSDFAMLNERLAEHYQIDGVAGPQIRRVTIDGSNVRGGLLSHGSVLKVSANGTNTSPVVRGVYVTERFLGKHAPPPPPGVPGIEPDTRGAVTLRELLDKHRDNDNCRACHALIDPPGFALESFDPIGGWRERFRTLGEGDRVIAVVGANKVRYKLGPNVDASGAFPSGEAFDGFTTFRDKLASRPEVLCRTMATKWLTFATGREMGFSDRAMINEIVKANASEGYGMRDLLQRVVASEIFRTK